MDTCSRVLTPTTKLKRTNKKSKNNAVLSPLIGNSKFDGDEKHIVSDDDESDDDIDDIDDEIEGSKSRNCLDLFSFCLRRVLGRCGKFSDQKTDAEDKREEVCFKLKQFSGRLDGVNRMLNEKIEEVQCKLKNLDDRRNELVDQILNCGSKGTTNNIVKIDLISMMKEIDVYSRQYEFFSNIKVNLMKLRANTDVHAFSDTVKDTLSLIPSNIRKIKSEKEFSLATRYSDALDDFANRMELPLNTVELQKIDLDENYEMKIDALLRDKNTLQSPQKTSQSPKAAEVTVCNPRSKVEPSISSSPRRNPVLLN